MLVRVRHSPPIIGGISLCISVILLVNECRYWLAVSKNTTYVVKIILLYNINYSVMKTLVFNVKQK